MAFDGSSIWVANAASDSLSGLNPSTGAKTDFFTGPIVVSPTDLMFDGTTIWVAFNGQSVLSKVNPATGSRTDYHPSQGIIATAYDGHSIWASTASSVLAFDPLGATVVNYPTGTAEQALAYDGTNMWVVDVNSNTVTKFVP